MKKKENMGFGGKLSLIFAIGQFLFSVYQVIDRKIKEKRQK
ncbi:hypothetical protein [Leuconostoc palmae]|nr:hypothetical protein [Leuconostoc palmae]